jgi:hypothetical protein
MSSAEIRMGGVKPPLPNNLPVTLLKLMDNVTFSARSLKSVNGLYK